MKLDTFQQYVKTNRITADYTVIDSGHFISTLETRCKDAYEEIINISDGSTDLSEVKSWARRGDHDKALYEMAKQDAISLNDYIRKTLAEIEDIEELNEIEAQNETCDIEASKRDRASNE